MASPAPTCSKSRRVGEFTAMAPGALLVGVVFPPTKFLFAPRSSIGIFFISPFPLFSHFPIVRK